ncbi:MAG: DUF1573 domain-containing protein [Pirellulales bacterium]
MRISTVVLVSIVLGAALGATASWARFHESPPLALEASAGPVPVVGTVIAVGKPKVLVDKQLHDFGALEHGVKAVHVFKLTNMGDAPLTLKAGTTTCTRCTIAEVEKKQLAPGETGNVRIEYTPTRTQPRFRQHATVITNDPDHKIVELDITGFVTSRFEVVPGVLVLSRISAKEEKTVEIRIYDNLSNAVSADKFEFTGASTARFFEVRTEPIPRDQMGTRKAKSGCRVLVTVKPGLPVGPIRQTIRFELRMASMAAPQTVEVPIEGTVDSDISLVGRDWNPDAGRLTFGAVESAKGAKRNLFLVLRGPQRHNTQVKVTSVSPSWLKVELGEPRELKVSAESDAGVTQIPLTIEIPPGSPAANHLGSDQGRFAEVMLETTNPDADRIRMYVQFVVLQ